MVQFCSILSSHKTKRKVKMSTNLDSQKILDNAKLEGDKWLEAFSLNMKPDREKIKAELSKRTFDGKPVVVRVVDSPAGVIPAVKELIQLGEENLTEVEISERLSELNLLGYIWDYYLMAFYGSAYKQCPDQSHEFGRQSFLEAFRAGLRFIINLGPAIVGVCLPEAYRDDQLRIHRQDGPAIVWGDEIVQYWWHGTRVEEDWIMKPESVNPTLCLTEENIERRRALCEIIGWEKVITQLDAKVVDENDDPEIGTLLEVDLPDSGRERFLKVRCGTGRTFVLPVPPNMSSALEANAWTYNFDADITKFRPEVRT